METKLRIEGMTCANCSQTVRHALTSIPGVESALVNFPSGEAEVRGSADPVVLIKAVEEAGYQAKVKESDRA